MQSSTFFVPGNISCLFVLLPDKDPSQSGSLGVGFTVDKGVTVTVQLSNKTEILFNDKKIDFSTVEAVIKKLLNNYSSREEQSDESSPLRSKSFEGQGSFTENVPRPSEVLTKEGRLRSNNSSLIKIYSDLPLGCGFGLSGASALATAYALNDFFNLKKDKLDLAKIAHIAEVENGTGMGDVVNEYFGGFFLKTVSSSQFIVQKIPITGVPVYCKYFSKLSTKEILLDKKKFEKINRAGKEAIGKVQEILQNNVIPTEFKERVEGSPTNLFLESDEKDSSSSLRFARNDNKKLFSKIIQISKAFAERSGLLTDKQVIKTIQDIESRGGHASMIMLGNAVFSDIPFAGATKLLIT